MLVKVLCLLFFMTIVPQGIANINFGLSGNSLSGNTAKKLKTNGQHCTCNNDCGYGLECISFICKCQRNEYWNNNYCETKLVLFFTTNDYTIKIINRYNGTKYIAFPYDVKVIEKPIYYIYVAHTFFGAIIQYDQFGSYVRHVTTWAFGLQPVGNSIYASGRGQKMYKLSSNLEEEYNAEPANSTYISDSRYIRLNPSNGHLYQCDFGTRYVNVFTKAYKRIESFKVFDNQQPYGIGFYKSAYLGNLLLVLTYSNALQILRQSDKKVVRIINTVCPVVQYSETYSYGEPLDIFVEQKSGYFIISCFNNDIKLFHTNGTHFTDTGKNKTFGTVAPAGMWFDSNGRLLVTSSNNYSFSIVTLNNSY